MKRIHYISKSFISNMIHPKIVVIGAGGTGSQVLHNLAKVNIALKMLGRREIILSCYDDDLVTEGNVGRQGFFKCDIGINKAKVLIDRLNFAYGMDWVANESRWEDEKLASNFVITCVDDVQSRLNVSKQINEIKTNGSRFNIQNRPLYWIDFGNTKYTGQMIIGTIKVEDQPTSKKFKPVRAMKTVTEIYPDLDKMEKEDIQGETCSILDPFAEQELFINSVLANIGVNMIYSFIKSNYTFYRGFYLNLDNYKMIPIEL